MNKLESLMPRYSNVDPQGSVDISVRDGDPRKTAYIVGLFTDARLGWIQFQSERSMGGWLFPSIVEIWRREGLLDHEVIPADKATAEAQKGRAVKIRGKHNEEKYYASRIHMAPEHMVTVAAGVAVLSELAIFDPFGLDKNRLVLAALTHDLNKPVEYRATRMTINHEDGRFGQVGYDLAADVSKQKLRLLGFPEDIIDLHQVVGHASCPQIEEELGNANVLTDRGLLRKLIMHYVDDIVTSPNIIDPSITIGENGERLNALDKRIMQNAQNPAYAGLNQAWITDPRNKTGETAFVQQRRVGHLVESAIAIRLGIEDPLTLPQVIFDLIAFDIQFYKT